ncbi:MAG: hypothetical protein AB8B63_17895 [Granulosicoccus sp.]
MRDLLELQTGQVAFISGLMSGFSLSIAVHVLRYGIRNRVAQVVFLMFLLSSLLFLLALYIDVRLSIALAGFDTVAVQVLEKIGTLRTVGTASATVALVVFVMATGLLGWLATPSTGVISTVLTGSALVVLWIAWSAVNAISITLGA